MYKSSCFTRIIILRFSVGSMAEEDSRSRRAILRLSTVGLTVGIAGCAGSGDSESGSVPSQYETAKGLNGQRRNPDNLQSKNALQYQNQPKNGNRCAGCAFYIKDKNGDNQGACTKVKGKISPDGWCASYSPNK